MSDRKRAIGALCLILTGRVAIQIQLYAAGFTALTADEFARTMLAARWARQPALTWHGVWLPFHQYGLGALLRLKWDLLLVPRYAVALLGLGSIVATYLIAFKLVRSRLAALLSALFLATNPTHIWLSSTPLSELPYLFCILVSFLGLLLYLEGARVGWLYLSAGALFVAEGLRFEGWIVAIAFVGVLAALRAGMINARPPARHLAAITLILAAFPLAWLAGNYIADQDPLAFLGAIQAYKLTWYGPYTDYGRYALKMFEIDPYIIPLLAGGLLALPCWRAGNHKHGVLLVLTIVPLISFLILHGGQIEPEANYIRYLGALLLAAYPFAGPALRGAFRALPGPGALINGALALAVCAIVGSNLQRSFRFVNDDTGAVVAVGQRLRELRLSGGAAEEGVIIEAAGWKYPAIQVGANGMANVFYDRPTPPLSGRSLFLDQPSLQELQSCLASYDIGFIVVADPEIRKAVQRIVGLPPGDQIAGYAIYAVPAASRRAWAALPPCRRTLKRSL